MICCTPMFFNHCFELYSERKKNFLRPRSATFLTLNPDPDPGKKQKIPADLFQCKFQGIVKIFRAHHSLAHCANNLAIQSSFKIRNWNKMWIVPSNLIFFPTPILKSWFSYPNFQAPFPSYPLDFLPSSALILKRRRYSFPFSFISHYILSQGPDIPILSLQRHSIIFFPNTHLKGGGGRELLNTPG